MQPIFDSTSCGPINDQDIATRYIGPAPAMLEELTTADFAIDHWQIVPREGPHDQDDLVALAIKPKT